MKNKSKIYLSVLKESQVLVYKDYWYIWIIGKEKRLSREIFLQAKGKDVGIWDIAIF